MDPNLYLSFVWVQADRTTIIYAIDFPEADERAIAKVRESFSRRESYASQRLVSRAKECRMSQSLCPPSVGGFS